MGQAFDPIPSPESDLARRESRGQLEFVGGRVKRIPERFKNLAALLREHFFGPDGLVDLAFSGFELGGSVSGRVAVSRRRREGCWLQPGRRKSSAAAKAARHSAASRQTLKTKLDRRTLKQIAVLILNMPTRIRKTRAARGSNSHYAIGARLCPKDQPQQVRCTKSLCISKACGWCSAHTRAPQNENCWAGACFIESRKVGHSLQFHPLRGRPHLRL